MLVTKRDDLKDLETVDYSFFFVRISAVFYKHFPKNKILIEISNKN
jgi:hypothetical protein